MPIVWSQYKKILPTKLCHIYEEKDKKLPEASLLQNIHLILIQNSPIFSGFSLTIKMYIGWNVIFSETFTRAESLFD